MPSVLVGDYVMLKGESSLSKVEVSLAVPHTGAQYFLLEDGQTIIEDDVGHVVGRTTPAFTVLVHDRGWMLMATDKIQLLGIVDKIGDGDNIYRFHKGKSRKLYTHDGDRIALARFLTGKTPSMVARLSNVEPPSSDGVDVIPVLSFDPDEKYFLLSTKPEGEEAIRQSGATVLA